MSLSGRRLTPPPAKDGERRDDWFKEMAELRKELSDTRAAVRGQDIDKIRARVKQERESGDKDQPNASQNRKNPEDKTPIPPEDAKPAAKPKDKPTAKPKDAEVKVVKPEVKPESDGGWGTVL